MSDFQRELSMDNYRRGKRFNSGLKKKKTQKNIGSTKPKTMGHHQSPQHRIAPLVTDILELTLAYKATKELTDTY